MSFAPMLTKTGERPWKGAALIQYLTIRPKPQLSGDMEVCHQSADEIREYFSAYGHSPDTEFDDEGIPLVCRDPILPTSPLRPLKQNHHLHDGPNNTFAALRIIDGEQDFLYAEFVNGYNPKAWDFAPDQLNFFEFYNVTEDFYMMHNLYDKMPKKLRQELHERLQSAIHCKGNKDCYSILKKQSSSI